MKQLAQSLLLILFALLVFCGEASAQCSLCKAAVSGSADAAQAASQVNLAVLVLLIPPVVLFVGIFGVGYRYRNIQGGRDTGDCASDEDDSF